MADTSTWQNSTFAGNQTAPPNSTILWPPIPLDARRDLQVDIVACAVITYVIALIFVLLRFYTRGWINHVLGPSDWCILPALLFAGGVTAGALDQMAHGAGRHSWEVDVAAELLGFERAAWYDILFYNLSLVFTRISILLLYQRIFTYSWIKRAIQIVLVLVILIGLWLVLSAATACVPLAAFWDWSLYLRTHVYCHPVNIWWANAALHIASDLVIMALPMPVLSSLKLPRRQKYALLAVFALGFFVCVISAVRLVALVDVTEQQAYDATYTSAYMIYWTSVEVNAAISCACIMTLKPLIQRVFPRILSPSKGFRDPTLQWITPLEGGGSLGTRGSSNTGTGTSRNSRQSFASSGRRRGSIGHASQHDSISSDRSRKRGSRSQSGSASASGGLPHVEEWEGDEYLMHPGEEYHEILYLSKLDSCHSHCHGNNHSPVSDFDLDRDRDLEAQRIYSALSTPTPTLGIGAVTQPVGEQRKDEEEGEKEAERPEAGNEKRPSVDHPQRVVSLLWKPPKSYPAHTGRLAIHVTRSVRVEKCPRSPSPGEDGDVEEKGDGRS